MNGGRLLTVIELDQVFNYGSWPAVANLHVFTSVTKFTLMDSRGIEALGEVHAALSLLSCAGVRAARRRIWPDHCGVGEVEQAGALAQCPHM